MDIYIYTHVYTHINIHANTYIYIYKRVCVCVCVCVSVTGLLCGSSFFVSFDFFGFNDISTFVRYLMTKQYFVFETKISHLHSNSQVSKTGEPDHSC